MVWRSWRCGVRSCRPQQSPKALDRQDAALFSGDYVFSAESDIWTPECQISMRGGTLCWSVEDDCFELVHIGNGGFIVASQPGFRVVMDGKQLALHIHEGVFMAYRREFAGMGGP